MPDGGGQGNSGGRCEDMSPAPGLRGRWEEERKREGSWDRWIEWGTRKMQEASERASGAAGKHSQLVYNKRDLAGLAVRAVIEQEEKIFRREEMSDGGATGSDGEVGLEMAMSHQQVSSASGSFESRIGRRLNKRWGGAGLGGFRGSCVEGLGWRTGTG